MSHFQQHREFFNRPIMLTVEEQQDPLSIIDDFFTDYNLCEIRKINEDTDHVCLTTDEHPFVEATARDCLIAYRRAQERVMEAIWVIWRHSTRTPAPDSDVSTTALESLKDRDIYNVLKCLSEILVDFGRLVDILITWPSKATPILSLYEASRMPKNTEQLPLDIEDVRQNALNLHSRLSQVISETIRLYIVNYPGILNK
jgi:hypothetical protein